MVKLETQVFFGNTNKTQVVVTMILALQNVVHVLFVALFFGAKDVSEGWGGRCVFINFIDQAMG